MATFCSRSAPLPQLATAPVDSSPFYGHGACSQGLVPSALRNTQRKVPGRGPLRVAVDYAKVRELCLREAARGQGEGEEKSHREFMSSYHLLVRREPANGSGSVEKGSETKRRFHSCKSPVERSHQVARHLEAIHGHRATKAVIDTPSRLKAMHRILRKLPLQRDAGEVKQLSYHISHFPSLLPTSTQTTPDVLAGIAARCLLDSLPQKGFSRERNLRAQQSYFPPYSAVPAKGGMYLILQGSVERKTRDASTQKIISKQLHEGECFGATEEAFVTKLSYPMFVTSSRCSLMRIAVKDYKRVLENCEEAERRERAMLTSSCPSLEGVGGAVTAALASDIEWETVAPNTILLQEGDTITRVGFIQSGSCKATMQVPQTSTRAQLVIGRMGPGSCLGESLLRGSERQPYQITSTTAVKIGWVPSTTITKCEVRKLIPAERELSIPVPSKDMVRHKYAQELMGLHWRKIKSDLMSEVKGDQPCQPKPIRWKI